MGLVIERYLDQHYSLLFNGNTGFLARVEDIGYDPPFWSAHGPELMDISLTTWCDRGCSTCYRSANSNGHHVTLDNLNIVLEQAKSMHVLQVALGGGNPNQHPDFAMILHLIREVYGIIPCYTTNGRGLSQPILKASKKYCGAVAVSAYPPYAETAEAIRSLGDHRVKTNVHFVLDGDSLDTAIAWLESPPSFLKGVNAIIFLNYKPVGRKQYTRRLLHTNPRVNDFFRMTAGHQHHFKLGFDSCLASGIAAFTDTSAICYDGCDAGRFSMFVSEDLRMYPCSFMTQGCIGVPVSSANMLETWQNDQLFVRMRERSLQGECLACEKQHDCLGGCPIFPEIDVCPHKIATGT